MDAREYFREVEQAVRDHRTAELILAYGEPRRGDGGGGHSTPGDPTARAAESAARAKATLTRTEAVIGEALARIEGLRLVVGRHAEVLEMRHVDLMAWADIADRLGVTTRTARNWRDTALDWVDSFGWAHVISGTGTAQI